MKKNKILALGVCVAMLATAVVGGTMAYFTDTDAQKNVMTTGKVDISQNEQQRDGDTLVDFAQDKPLMPAVYTAEITEKNIVVDGYFNPAINNVVDKIVTVKNEANSGAKNQDAFVRTILAFETITEYKAGTAEVLRNGKEIFNTYIATCGDFELLDRPTIKIDGVEYVLAVKVYDEALAPQDVSAPSLKQIFMAPGANNEVYDWFDGEYTILTVSQGTQTAGFDGNAELALNTAFGDLEDTEKVTDAMLAEWLKAGKKE